MIFTRTALPTNPLTSRLLGSASLSALVLAASFAVTAPALAQQEIIGPDAANANLLTAGGTDIISGNTGGQFGAINVNNDVTYTSITLTQSETILVFDSVGGNETATVTNDFVINSGVTGTLIFVQDDTGGDALEADLAITGDLEGTADGRGGTLNLTMRQGVPQDGSEFSVRGSTHLTAITVAAGDAEPLADGGNIAAQFGDGGDDAFDVTGLTVNGGNGGDMQAGGDATVTINDHGTGVVTIGTGGIAVNGGNVTNLDSGDGGMAVLEIQDSATIAGPVNVVGGDEGNVPAIAINGGTARLDFSDTSSTVTVNGILTIATGNDTAGVASIAGDAEVRVASTTFNANGGIVLTEQQNETATLILDGTADQTINGAVTVTNDGDGEIEADNAGDGQTITFTGTLGTDAMRIGAVDLNNGDIFVFQGNVFANSFDVATNGTAHLRGTMSVLEGTTGAGNIVVGDGTSAASLTFEGPAPAAHTGTTTINGMGTLVVNDLDGAGVFVSGDIVGGATSGTTLRTTAGVAVPTGVAFNGDVGTTNPIGLIDVDAITQFAGNDTFAINMDVATGVTAAALQDLFVRGDLTGMGTLVVGNADTDRLFLGTAGQTSTVSIANINGPGDIHILAGTNVVISSTIGAGAAINAFSMNDLNTVITFNGTAAVSLIGTSLQFGDGTIILGSNIGNGDTVFQITTDLGGTTANRGTVVQVSAGFTAGDVITLVDAPGNTQADIDANFANGEFVVTDTALMDFTLAQGGDTSEIAITGVATTNTQAAATLGVSTEQADALRQATQSGDATLVDLLSTALNTGGAQATLAAQQVGVQSETGVGGLVVSREMAGQQQGVTQGRISGFRSDDPAFAFNGNGETGFAGGDLDAPYTPMGSRYANSVWGQVYGGTALADGATALAGFDAGYGGAMIGIDGSVTDDIVIGAFAGYGFADVDGEGAGNAQLETSAYQAGVYAGYTGAGFYVDAFAAYAMTQNDTQRTTFGNTSVTGEFDASQISVGLSGGAPIAISPNAYLTPNASLTWNHYDADGYTEVGVGANTVAGFSANTLTGTIGARLHAVYEMSDGSAIIPELSAGLLYDLVDDDGRASATFVGGGTAYTVSGTEISDIGAVLGAGLTMRNDTWSFGLSYEGDIRSDFMSHTGRAEIRMRF